MLQNGIKMKTKLIAMQWRGSASVDPRFSAAMLPWSIADIYSRDQFLNVSNIYSHRRHRPYCYVHKLNVGLRRDYHEHDDKYKRVLEARW